MLKRNMSVVWYDQSVLNGVISGALNSLMSLSEPVAAVILDSTLSTEVNHYQFW